MTTRGQIRHAFPAFRVFIFGTDVTEDVTEVSVNWNYGRAPNTCSIALLNADDKYIYTTKDLNLIYGDDFLIRAAKQKEKKLVEAFNKNENFLIGSGAHGVSTSDSEDFEFIEDEILRNVEKINPEVKRTILGKKLTVRVPGIPAPEVDGELSSLNPLKGDAFRYPLQAEDPIFHPNDPIRIFFRDPFYPTRWYHMFAGLVGDFDDMVDENNQRVLTVGGEGPTKLFRYARVTFDPGIIDINALADVERDVKIRTFWKTGLANLTLPELMFFMVFGNNPDDETGQFFSLRKDSPVGASVTQSSVSGVGNFSYKRSAVLEYGPPASGGTEDALKGINIFPVESLSVWQSLIDHEVKITDIEEMALESEASAASGFKQEVTYLSNGNPDPTSIISIIGSNTNVYPVDGGRLLLLIPASFHPTTNREALLRDILPNPSLTTEFASRLRVIHDTIERIEFVFYESPKGDLICEFPLYDFDPDDFGIEEPEHHNSVENGKILTDVEEVRGPFGSRYVLTKRDTVNFSRQITDEKVRTQVIGHWNTIQSMSDLGLSKEYQSGAVITLKHLVPLYGYRTEQVNPKGFISTKEAAYAYAHIVLNKMNADSRNLGINAIPNFGLWPNRPLYFKQRNCIGNIVSLDHSIKWGMGGSVDTRVNLNYLRGWDGLINEKGEAEFTAIGGHPSRPLNYKILFRLTNPDSGSNPDTPSTT